MIFTQSSIALGLAGLAAASPYSQKPLEDYPEVQARKKLHLGTAIGGALDLPTVTDAPAPTAAAAAAAAAN